MNPPKHMIYEWSHSQLSEKRQQSPVEKESTEMMIRELKSIFCKGRYRSWRSFRKYHRYTYWNRDDKQSSRQNKNPYVSGAEKSSIKINKYGG